MTTLDEYKVELQRLVTSLGVPVEIKEVRPAAGAANPDLTLDVTGAFWGGTFRVTITKQALDTTIMGANLMQAFEKPEGVVVAQEIFESAAYKRIDAIIAPAREVLDSLRNFPWQDVARGGGTSSWETLQARAERTRLAIDAEMQLRSASAPTPPVPTDAPSSVAPDER